MKIKKSTNNATNLDAALMTVNNFSRIGSKKLMLNGMVTKFRFRH